MEGSDNMKQSIITRGAMEARTLYELIRQMAIGDVLTYAQLGEKIGRQPGDLDKWRSALGRARRRATREDAIATDVIVREGIRRMTDAELAGVGPKSSHEIRRKAGLAVQKMSCVAKPDALDVAIRDRINTYVSCFGAISELAKEKTITKLVDRVAKQQHTLTPALVGDVLRE
jgi:hypothetical protein